MDIAQIKAYTSGHMDRVSRLMEKALSSDIDLLDKTNASILEGGGKRLRPLVCILVADVCGGVCDDAMKFAAATELFHNATLMHDDVVDGADTRRGRPTVMSVLNTSASVLIGDFWLTRAMDIVLSAEHCSSEVIRVFSKTLSDLAEGEMLQLEKSLACDTGLEDYHRIVYCKTASLFEAAAMSAAIAAGAPDAWREAVRDYAVNLGIAFQVKDDILDYVGGDIGKPSGQDLLERKVTMPLLGALEGVSEEKERSIRALLAEGGNEAAIAAFVAERGGVAKAVDVLDSYVRKACLALDILPECPAKEYLAEIARFNAMREK